MAAPAGPTTLNGASAPSAESSYPYGLTLTLEAEQLEALGVSLEELPSAGNGFHLEAYGVIRRSITEDPDADGDVDRVCLELQITHMGFEHESAGKNDNDSGQSYSQRLYGVKEG